MRISQQAMPEVQRTFYVSLGLLVETEIKVGIANGLPD
jgi:hypothetical protein